MQSARVIGSGRWSMRILIACEFSGIVRDAFINRGHTVYSCDLIPSIRSGPHIQRDVITLLDMKWDLMIAFPPCTHLASSGARWWPMKVQQQAEALDFVRRLMEAPIPSIAIENPIGKISTAIRKPDQIIQPWQFGCPESKATCLWLKNLPKLEPTMILKLPDRGVWDNQTLSGQNKLPPTVDRSQLRSLTYQGVAIAMANQWG